MSDLIDREDAIDAINAYLGLSAVSRTIQNMTSIQEILENLPSAEPRKKGRWIEHHEPYSWMGYAYWSCSKCNFGEKEENKERSNFCPNCGADMREGDSN